MLTLFTIPKPFAGHIGVIQRNALESWSQLPGVQILLCGDEDGVGEAASEFGAGHVPGISRNEFGTPLVGSAFGEARRRSSQRYLCYANADLILLPDLLEAVQTVSTRWRDFLIAGQRWNLAVRTRLDFGRADWEQRLRAEVARAGEKEPPWGSDYFVFPRQLDLGPFPAFAVGRPRWDNWLIYRARALGIPTVDATERVTVVHQLHDYAHIPGRVSQAPKSAHDTWQGPEAEINRALARETTGVDFGFHLHDATHLLTRRGLRPALGRDLRRRWKVWRILHPVFRRRPPG